MTFGSYCESWLTAEVALPEESYGCPELSVEEVGGRSMSDIILILH
jgi:hypothetical protein